jgi:hypothetical protein
MWSMCMWVSTTSVTDARSNPAASSRKRQPPGLLEVWELQTQPSVDEYRPVAATHHATFSGHSSTSGGRNWSSSQDARSAESAL